MQLSDTKVNHFLIIKWAIITTLVTLVYYSTFVQLYESFSAADSYYSHGFLVPFIVVYLIWKKRDRFKTTSLDSSKLGLIILISGIFIHLLGIITEVYLFSKLSILLVLFGIVLYLFGKKIGKEVLFPLSFLIFMIPIPMFVINYITFPMRLMVTKLATSTLSWFGLPITHKGFEIIFPNTSLVIGTPCSGLRSVITFLALGSLLAYFLRASIKKKILLFLMAIPIALITNYFRVILLSLIAFIYGGKTATEGFLHNFSGILVFVIGFAILIFLMRLLECQGLQKDI